ncbi:MAG: AhpC/TSA family protein [Bacteroidales bacterium]|nr:AhpC/TSA family protein [Candidatus Cacconaster merdequi]
MKRFFIILSVCLLAVSCSSKCVIEGLFESGEDNSAVAVVFDKSTDVKDTCAIVDGKFTYECPASDTTILSIQIAGDGENHHKAASLIPTKGTVTVDFNADPVTVTGSALTDTLRCFIEGYGAFYVEYQERLAELGHTLGEDSPELDSAHEALYEEINEKMQEFATDVFWRNKSNAVGLTALKEQIYDLSLEQMDDMLADAPAFIKNDASVTRIHNAKVNEQATSEGKDFVDFEGRNPEGDIARLSDYVGRGKYVLVDFWASWCGPCKREIPNIKELYDAYSAKGLVVLGVAVWDKDNSGSRKVMEQLGMTWPQIFMGEDTAPTDLYGIVGIPHIILFSPDGKIAERNLRGAQMKATVAELFK